MNFLVSATALFAAVTPSSTKSVPKMRGPCGLTVVAVRFVRSVSLHTGAPTGENKYYDRKNKYYDRKNRYYDRKNKYYDRKNKYYDRKNKYYDRNSCRSDRNFYRSTCNRRA